MFGRLGKVFIRNRFAVIALLFLMLETGYFFLLSSIGIGEKQAWFECIASYFLILFFSFILQRIHTYYHSRSAISIVHLSIIFFFSLLTTLFLQEYGHWIMDNDDIYRHFISKAFYFRWFILFLIFLALVNQLWIDKHLIEQKHSFDRLIDKETQLMKAEMSSLQDKFKPHFLFNSLNSINALVKSQPELAREMIHHLSDYLRMTLQKSNDDLTSVKEEFDYLNLYLEIEKVRFGHRLNVIVQKDEKCDEILLPALILQPIVENAIKFGLYGNTGDLTISIVVQCNPGMLMISVRNPYDAVSSTTSPGTGFGLDSIRKKLALLYKRNDLLITEKTEYEFETTLHIPYHEKSDHN